MHDSRKVVLITNIFEGIMVSEEDKFSMKDIMAPMLHRLKDCIELHIVSAIAEFGTRKFLTEVGDSATRLA